MGDDGSAAVRVYGEDDPVPEAQRDLGSADDDARRPQFRHGDIVVLRSGFAFRLDDRLRAVLVAEQTVHVDIRWSRPTT